MSLPVVTVASRGLPIVEVAAGKLALPVVEAINGRGLAVVKVTNGLGLPVNYGGSSRVSPDNMTSDSAPPPYVASALSSYPGFFAYFAFNSSLTTYWATTTALPQWLKIDLGAPTAASRYSLTAADNQPTAWTLEGSNNDSTWTTADIRSGIAVVPQWTVNTYTMVTPGTYRYWRWTFTASGVSGVAQANVALYP
jgi:hypothetical protein